MTPFSLADIKNFKEEHITQGHCGGGGVRPPSAPECKGGKFGGKMNTLREKIVFLPSTNFKSLSRK